MEILRETPTSVLWLASMPPEAKDNLRREAISAGVDANRLVFAERTDSHEDHLQRIALADLFIDTRNYNAHTTACEALMMGVPVVTVTGNSFAGRVAASLLKTLGLPELIATDYGQYKALILDLAQNKEKLLKLKSRLWNLRTESVLFDTAHTTRNIEKALDLMWGRAAQGLPPDHLDISS